jgi:hypothetical protein
VLSVNLRFAVYKIRALRQVIFSYPSEGMIKRSLACYTMPEAAGEAH